MTRTGLRILVYGSLAIGAAAAAWIQQRENAPPPALASCTTAGCTQGGCAPAPRPAGKEPPLPPAEKPSALPSIDLEVPEAWQTATFGLG